LVLMADPNKVKVWPVRGADGRLYGRGMPQDVGLGKTLYWPYKGPDGRLYARGRDSQGRLFKAFPYKDSEHGRLMFRSMRDSEPCVIYCGPDPKCKLQPTYKLCLRRFNAQLDGTHEVRHDATIQSPCTWKNAAGTVVMTLSTTGVLEVKPSGACTTYRRTIGVCADPGNYASAAPHGNGEIPPVNTSCKGRVWIIGSCNGPNYSCGVIPCDSYCGSCLLKDSYTICWQSSEAEWSSGTFNDVWNQNDAGIYVLPAVSPCTWRKTFTAVGPLGATSNLTMKLTYDGAKFVLEVWGTVYPNCTIQLAVFHVVVDECYRQAKMAPQDNPPYPIVMTRQAGLGKASIIGDGCVGKKASCDCWACENPAMHRPPSVNVVMQADEAASPPSWGVAETLPLLRVEAEGNDFETWIYEKLNIDWPENEAMPTWGHIRVILKWGTHGPTYHNGYAVVTSAPIASLDASPIPGFLAERPFYPNCPTEPCGCRHQYDGRTCAGRFWDWHAGDFGDVTVSWQGVAP
jgi:hypothetical protein